MKRLFALFGAICLLGLYVVALFFAFSKRPDAGNWLMAAIFAIVFISVVLYAWTLAVKFGKRKEQSKDPLDS